jgi:glycosyltransferase involved in cell wall biosynthesis
MPRILRIINRFNIGGPTYNAAYLSKYLPTNYETLLIGGSPQAHEAHSGYILDDLYITYHEIPEMGRSVRILDDWKAFRALCKIIREFQPDIVHTHAAKAGALGRLAAKIYGVPVVVHTYHGHVFEGYFKGLKNWLVKSIERMLGRMTTAIIAISPIQCDQISMQHRIAPIHKMRVIPLGFDLSRFNTDQPSKRQKFRSQYLLEESEIAIGIIGRLTAIKQQTLFLNAFALVAMQQPQVRGFVIGDGELRQALESEWEQLCGSHGLHPSRMVFTSWIKEIDVALAGLDIVAMTSINEGTPVSLIEAQAAGKPVVTTNVGGVNDCVSPDRSGLIVQDHLPTSFAHALLQLVQNPSERHAMGRLGQNFVMEKYSYMRLVTDIDNLYMELFQDQSRNEGVHS